MWSGDAGRQDRVDYSLLKMTLRGLTFNFDHRGAGIWNQRSKLDRTYSAIHASLGPAKNNGKISSADTLWTLQADLTVEADEIVSAEKAQSRALRGFEYGGPTRT